MKNLLLFSFFCFYTLSVFGQVDFFAFANDEAGKAAKGKATNYKLDTATKVFNALVDGQGDFRTTRPSLIMKNSERYVAWAQPEKAEIGLEELAYDVCVSFGADSLNALAALLTHELVHYYEKHEWSRHFVKENKDLPAAQLMEKLEEGLKLETQADYLGGFLAYSVGFKVHGVMPQLLKKIYAEEAYDLPEQIDGYPSLQDRITMSEKAMKRLQALQLVFETANYLSLLERYDAADKYYSYILKDFQSRDIYNNAGVNALLSALPYFTKKEMPYALPIELDPKSRLQTTVTRSSDRTREQERAARIQRALDYFEQAYSLDKQYVPTLLNQAAAYVLRQEGDDAGYWLRKAAKEKPDGKIAVDHLVLKGLVALQEQDLEEARDFWERARKQKSYLAELNLKVLENGGTLPSDEADDAIGFGTKPMKQLKEQVDELDLDGFLKQTAPDQMVKVDLQTICGLHLRPESSIYSHSVDYGREFISIQLVGDTYPGKSMEGIRIGDTRDQLFEKYGPAERQIQTPEGEYLVFPSRNIFFECNENAKVSGWGVFRIKEK